MKRIGITGGIGAGKSLICQVFELLGIPNYPADIRAKWLQTNDPKLKSQIAQYFGAKAYHENGDLNREYLSKEVFADDKKLQTLNELVHPAVAKDFEQWCESHQDRYYVLKEAALLFETKSYQSLDATINVHASQELRLKRTLSRDSGRTKETVKAIMSKQLSDEQRLKLADYTIYNDETQSVIHQVLEIHEKLIN